jgi:hypothetical protein
MSISSVSSTATAPETGETKVGGVDAKNDHDKDDVAVTARAARALATTNASGQPIGTTISKSA